MAFLFLICFNMLMLLVLFPSSPSSTNSTCETVFLEMITKALSSSRQVSPKGLQLQAPGPLWGLLSLILALSWGREMTIFPPCPWRKCCCNPALLNHCNRLDINHINDPGTAPDGGREEEGQHNKRKIEQDTGRGVSRCHQHNIYWRQRKAMNWFLCYWGVTWRQDFRAKQRKQNIMASYNTPATIYGPFCEHSGA